VVRKVVLVSLVNKEKSVHKETTVI
jgi:hypothetical protein